MNVWLLGCMMFVAAVTFEYAILLAIRFSRSNKINAKGGAENIMEKCNQVDNISLRIFVGVYVLMMGTYFYKIDALSKL